LYDGVMVQGEAIANTRQHGFDQQGAKNDPFYPWESPVERQALREDDGEKGQRKRREHLEPHNERRKKGLKRVFKAEQNAGLSDRVRNAQHHQEQEPGSLVADANRSDPESESETE